MLNFREQREQGGLRMKATRMIMTGAASLTLVVSAASAQPEACARADSAMRAKEFSVALGAWTECAAISGQTHDQIARAHLARLAIFEQTSDAAGAEAELVALTTAPISDYPVFSGRDSVGVTQAGLHVHRARYRAAASDFGGALAESEAALRLASAGPTLELEDLNAAYGMRAKARVYLKDDRAVGDVVRAYVRGSKDEWIVAQTKTFPAQAQAALQAMRTTFLGAAVKYALAGSVLADGDAAQRAKDSADAKAVMETVEAQEANLAGVP